MLDLLQAVFDGVAGFQRTPAQDADAEGNEHNDPIGETRQARSKGPGAMVVTDFTLSSRR